MASADAPVFEALLVPHRSLTRRGRATVLTALVVASCALALRFWLLGAWPVVVFSFVDIPLLIALLALNQRGARASELIMLDAAQLTVVRTDPAGRRKQEALPAAWLRIKLESAGGVPRLILSSHGRNCEVGAFLHEPDKLSLFEALRDALHRLKNPRFDNPQLRAEP
jgi:uncharacterized membrane protein